MKTAVLNTCIVWAALAAAGSAQAGTLQTLTRFADGVLPNSLARAPDGSLYGGAYFVSTPDQPSFGFRLAPPVSPRTRWKFEKLDYGTACPGVQAPASKILGWVFDQGGAYAVVSVSTATWLLHLRPPSTKNANWQCTVLHKYPSAHPGDGPYAVLPLSIGSDGGLYAYAMTDVAGAVTSIIARLGSPQDGWHPSTAYSFPSGQTPYSIAADTAGRFFGILDHVSVGSAAFQLSPPAPGTAGWQLNDLYDFPEGTVIGDQPNDILTEDADGSLYGNYLYEGGYEIYRLAPPAGGGQWSFANVTQVPMLPPHPRRTEAEGSPLPQPGGVLLQGSTKGIFALAPPADGQGWTYSVTQVANPEHRLNEGGFRMMIPGSGTTVYGATLGTPSTIYGFTP